MPTLRKTKEEIRIGKIRRAFKNALDDKGWTQDHLAKLCGMNTSFLNQVINHPMKREFRTLLLIADKLGVNFLSSNLDQ